MERLNLFEHAIVNKVQIYFDKSPKVGNKNQDVLRRHKKILTKRIIIINT